jgi:hypothetical protein
MVYSRIIRKEDEDISYLYKGKLACIKQRQKKIDAIPILKQTLPNKNVFY